jgi:YfiH family protein
VFAFQDAYGPVEVAFTDRHGGVSGGPYASLDLGRGEPDDAAARENLQRVATAFSGDAGAGLVAMHQVHGADVHRVDSVGDGVGDGAGQGSGGAAAPLVADAVVTTTPGVTLLVRVADCVPVLLADADAGVVAAVHSGRPGLVAGVVPAAVEAMRTAGARTIRAWVGPHVCGACYEVPEQMRSDVASAVPVAHARTSWGTPALDIGAGVLDQLARAGVEVAHASPRCTVEDEDLYSYRRQGAASGRSGGLVRIRP